MPILLANIAPTANVMTDEAGQYNSLRRYFASHDFTRHSAGEYVRGLIHTNTVEGFYSVFKRGMKGVYQHCGEQHLHRYVTEFDFRYNSRVRFGISDTDRADRASQGVVGKRLTYRTTVAGRRPKCRLALPEAYAREGIIEDNRQMKMEV